MLKRVEYGDCQGQEDGKLSKKWDDQLTMYMKALDIADYITQRHKIVEQMLGPRLGVDGQKGVGEVEGAA